MVGWETRIEFEKREKQKEDDGLLLIKIMNEDDWRNVIIFRVCKNEWEEEVWVCGTIIGGKKKSRADELERKNKDTGVWKVVDFGICFDRRSSNVQQKGGQGLVGILLRTLTNISLDILVSHGLDITHHLHQAVRVYFVFVFIHNSIIMPFKHIMFNFFFE